MPCAKLQRERKDLIVLSFQSGNAFSLGISLLYKQFINSWRSWNNSHICLTLFSKVREDLRTTSTTCLDETMIGLFELSFPAFPWHFPCLSLAVSILQLLESKHPEVQISPLGTPGVLICSCGYVDEKWCQHQQGQKQLINEAALEVKEDHKRHHSSIMLYCS